MLFVDCHFLDDPKIATLTDSEFREWMRVLTEHVQHGNGSELPRHAYGASRRRVQRYLELGLLDEEEDSLYVHAWDSWNGREAYKRFLNRERVRRFRERRQGDL